MTRSKIRSPLSPLPASSSHLPHYFPTVTLITFAHLYHGCSERSDESSKTNHSQGEEGSGDDRKSGFPDNDPPLTGMSSLQNPHKRASSRTCVHRTFLLAVTPRYSKSSWRRSESRSFRYTKSSRCKLSNSLRLSFLFCSTRKLLCS